jgi:6-phosphogluconolactonase (cycloisomerase 2 family)
MATRQKAFTINARVRNVFGHFAEPADRSSDRKGTGMRVLSSQSLITCTLIALILAGLALLLGPTPRTFGAAKWFSSGYVFVLNNDLSGSNSITVFTRGTDGSLTLLGVTSIGGVGSVSAFADGTQGSLILTPDGSRLFAVDAGSNQISVVDVHGGQLSPVGTFSSGGTGPVSLSYRAGLLYVLNAANGTSQSANVVGFHVDRKGRLHRIHGATRPLSTSQPNPAEVLIDPTGHFLVVTEKMTNLIDVYQIHQDGSLSGPTTYPSTGVYPFGMAFDPASKHELIVDDGMGGQNGTGAVTAYRLVHGSVQLINGPVPDYQVAPCWMVITRDGHYAYTSDADSHTISGYRIHDNGKISLLDPDGVTGSTPSDTFPLEEGLSHNSRYLYVLDSRLLNSPPGPATLSGFRIHGDGSLTTVIDPSQFSLPFSAIGLAAD